MRIKEGPQRYGMREESTREELLIKGNSHIVDSILERHAKNLYTHIVKPLLLPSRGDR